MRWCVNEENKFRPLISLIGTYHLNPWNIRDIRGINKEKTFRPLIALIALISTYHLNPCNIREIRGTKKKEDDYHF